MMIPIRVGVVVAVTLLAGCAWVGETVRSELSAYAEPTGTDVAYVRLIGSRNVKVYPGSVCAASDVPGSGYPAGPQMGGQRKRDLGMPKLVTTPRHYVEIAAKPGDPMTVVFMVQNRRPISAGNPATGRPMLHQTSVCNGARTFTPQSGQQYEVVLNGASRNCRINVYRLLPPRDPYAVWQREMVDSAPAGRC